MRGNERIDPASLGLTNILWLSGDEIMATCPFHDDNSPSMAVNLIKGLYICYGCGAAGRVQRLALELGGRVTHTMKRTGREIDDAWRTYLTAPLAIGNKYLASRLVDDATVKRHGLLALPSGIGVPLHNRRGGVCGLLVRRPNNAHGSAFARYVTYGTKPDVWPMCTALEHDDGLVFTEGVFGALNMERCHYRGVATLGAAIRQEAGWALNKPNSVLIFDDDAAGYLGAGRALRLAPGLRVSLPGGEADEMKFNEVMDRVNAVFTHHVTLEEIAAHYGDRREFYSKLPDAGWGWKHSRVRNR